MQDKKLKLAPYLLIHMNYEVYTMSRGMLRPYEVYEKLELAPNLPMIQIYEKAGTLTATIPQYKPHWHQGGKSIL